MHTFSYSCKFQGIQEVPMPQLRNDRWWTDEMNVSVLEHRPISEGLEVWARALQPKGQKTNQR